jgi:hypothetical protein
VSWDREFDDPVHAAGKPLLTLRDAANLIRRLPKAKHDLPHWQAAAEALIMAAEGRGPIEHARIGMLRALNFGKPDPKLEPTKKRAKRYKIIGGG